ncbi:MAG: ATP-binding protein [Chloroflexi bacterium]|uniref:ATP-binding protein n=1 Tax=Candidatus Flexifilum breve TaxID=3140694 RepID=UPI003135B48B|nr:ATP-binding protein [Chloroflexota bacterium]
MFPRTGRVSLLDSEARLGVVVSGSLSKGLVIKLDSGQSVEELAVGRYIVVHGHQRRFFCMITDVVLDSSNPDIQNAPPDISDPFFEAIYIGTAAYGKIHAQPMLSIDDTESHPKPKPVKTIPGHFMRVMNATVEDVNAVFGEEEGMNFNVGAPLELEETQINLNLKKLVERSVGGAAVNLIFDMHNDYGWEATNEGGPRVKGLKQLFNDKVSICTLDPESSLKRNAKVDFEVKLGYDEVEPEDIEALRETMGLTDAMLDAARTVAKRWGERWIERTINANNEDIDEIEQTTPIRSGTFVGLQRRLQRFERWQFLVPQSPGDSVAQIVKLLEGGRSVVLEFGRYGNSLEAYMLVANYLTRRIHSLYIDKVERAMGDASMEPPQLLITIEEAHKFLDPKIASQTTFGIIAREMRKYNVTLLIVDQRPSGIDEEVLSQVGTRVTALLDNERDINAVLTGISGAAGLREVLSRLDTKQQAIIMGHAVPMPVVVKTRSYDEAFYEAMLRGEIGGKPLGATRERLGNGSKERRLR